MSTFDPIKESHLIGNLYMHPEHGTYELKGILLGEDDWYWHMVSAELHPQVYNLSCVGDIEGHGFSLIRKAEPRDWVWEAMIADTVEEENSNE